MFVDFLVPIFDNLSTEQEQRAKPTPRASLQPEYFTARYRLLNDASLF